MNSTEKFINGVRKTAKEFLVLNPDKATIIHHNDTDGLTSGVILETALKRQGIEVQSFCLEKTFPQILYKIFDEHIQPDGVVFITDFGSGMLPTLAEINKGKGEVFVLDHHTISPTTDKKIHLLNCNDYGISGSRDCSASVVCYLFSKELNTDNLDLSVFGILGALGDGYTDSKGNFTSVNAIVYEQTKNLNLITRKCNGEFYLQIANERLAVKRAIHLIDSLGSYGYLKGGPEIAKAALISGFNQSAIDIANQFSSEFDAVFLSFIKELQLNKSQHIDWFILDERFSTFGVKTVGLVCGELIRRDITDPEKYVAGFQAVPNTFPGIGTVKLNETKVSMRVPRLLREKVDNKMYPPLNKLLTVATEQLDGFIDACHEHAAATTIKMGLEKKLIEEMETILLALTNSK